MAIDRAYLKNSAAMLAASGVFIGTSSWKYPGWRGQLYDEARYEWRGKFAQSRFEKNCLAEYAEVFKTVCVDAAYYTSFNVLLPVPQRQKNIKREYSLAQWRVSESAEYGYE